MVDVPLFKSIQPNARRTHFLRTYVDIFDTTVLIGYCGNQCDITGVLEWDGDLADVDCVRCMKRAKCLPKGF